LYRLKRLVGLQAGHPFGSPAAVKKIVHAATVDSIAEIMGTVEVFGEREARMDARMDFISYTHVSRHKCAHFHAHTNHADEHTHS
jgi:gamma-glutamyl phosphate reductase